MTLAQRQREQLCDLFDELGPFAPTLAGEWRTQELAAHLWIREHKPAALPGIGFQRFADRTARIQLHALHTLGFPELVRQLRRPNPLIRLLDPVINSAELTIHHMDVLKPQGRVLVLSHKDQKQLWRYVTVLARRARPGIRLVLEWQDGKIQLGSGSRTVHVLGAPSELLFYFSGRTEDADLTTVGEADALQRLKDSIKGL